MIDIRIRNLVLEDTETLTGVVRQVKTILTIENQSMFKTFTLADPPPEEHVALEEVTDEMIMAWIKPLLEADLEGLRETVYRKNLSKQKQAVKQVDPETGVVSYQREDHVNEWKPDTAYEKGDSFYYTWETTETVDTGEVDENGDPIIEEVTTVHKEFYTVVQDHTSQANWLPNEVAALYTSNFIFQGDFPEWKQPQGAHDAYPIDMVVRRNGKWYKSLVADNVWEPGTDDTLWEEVDSKGEPLPETPEGETTPEPWVQPTGAHNAYNTGDRASYNGSIWESNVDGNVWAPPTQWTEV